MYLQHVMGLMGRVLLGVRQTVCSLGSQSVDGGDGGGETEALQNLCSNPLVIWGSGSDLVWHENGPEPDPNWTRPQLGSGFSLRARTGPGSGSGFRGNGL
jgi:hypothetical protein